MGKCINPDQATNHEKWWRRQELERAIALHDGGKTWNEVARIMGRSSGSSVSAAVMKYQRGLTRCVIDEHDEMAQVFLRLALQGLSVAEIARRHKRWPSSVWTTLARLGYDQETIQEERELINATVSGHAAPHSGQRAA